jgi:hypothetical protein
MNADQYKIFTDLTGKIVKALSTNRTVTLQPSKKAADAFQAAIDLLTVEYNRRQSVRKNTGRPRRPDSEVTPYALKRRKQRETARSIARSVPPAVAGG